VAPPAAGADRQAPRVSLAATPRRQRALRRRAVLVRMRCDERCRTAATGSLLARGRSYGTPPARASLHARATATVRVRLGTRARAAARRALLARRGVTVRVHVRATDAAGNATTRSVRVTVRG
jgi:hypothetical protein